MNRYDFIISTIKEAGAMLLQTQKRGLNVSAKVGDPRDLVTNADFEINDFITKKIRESFPDDSIYSEETKHDPNLVDSYWTIDPIDGTSNFAKGIPHFASAIAFVDNGEPVVGAVYNPATQESFSFEKGKGVFLNGEQVSVSKVTNIKEASVLLHIGRKEDVRDWGIDLHRFFLGNVSKVINLGSSALDLCFLAAGRVDAVVYGTMTTKDISVALGMVREAGGEVYNLDGKPATLLEAPQQIIATSTRDLFDAIAKI